jgi:hypothetical protein
MFSFSVNNNERERQIITQSDAPSIARYPGMPRANLSVAIIIEGRSLNDVQNLRLERVVPVK